MDDPAFRSKTMCWPLVPKRTSGVCVHITGFICPTLQGLKRVVHTARSSQARNHARRPDVLARITDTSLPSVPDGLPQRLRLKRFGRILCGSSVRHTPRQRNAPGVVLHIDAVRHADCCALAGNLDRHPTAAGD